MKPVTFDYDLTDKLKDIVQKLRKKDARRCEILYNKIRQITQSDDVSIGHYKNLRHGMSDCRRVHIDSSFVLTFHYDPSRKFILFLDFDHHDRIYGKK